MAGDPQVDTCFTNDAEPCGAIPLAYDTRNESGGTARASSSAPPRGPDPNPEIEAISLLARRMSHDLNNLLAIITSYTEVLLEDLGPDHASRPDLEEVRNAAERARGVTRQFSLLARSWPSPQADDSNQMRSESGAGFARR
jgi:signal transduction histidine kinase